MTNPTTDRRDAPDPGAFSSVPGLEEEKLRNAIQGREFRTTNIFARETREPNAWTGPFLMTVYREVFGSLFPDKAGRFRDNEAIFGRRAAPPHETLDALMQQLVLQMREHLTAVRAEGDRALQMDFAFRFAAIDDAEMLRIHPFADGNGRWARIVTVLFLVDCGLPVGTIVRRSEKKTYIAAADRCIDSKEPGDLANLFRMIYD